MVDLLFTFVYVAIYIAILSVVENPTIRRIRKSSDIREILRYRKRLSRIRKTSLIVFYICISLPWLYIAYIDYTEDVKELNAAFYLCIFIYSFAGSYLWIRRRNHHNPLSCIYDLSKEDVLRSKKPYVLFLRSFEKDDYTPEIFIRKRTKTFPCFSEYHFTKLLYQYRNTYAVGMSQEIEAPSGAKRVYLSDTEWQQDVLELMEKAACIIILLDARPSCIWEIEQSASMLRKTIFIVDDAAKYTEAVQKLNGAITLPELSSEQKTPLALHSADGNHFSITPFEHNLRSYRRVIRLLARDFKDLKARLAPFRRLAENRVVIFILVYVMSCLMSALSERMYYEAYGEQPDENAGGLHAIVLMILYYGLFTKTFTEMLNFMRKFIRWIMLMIGSLFCAELCASCAGEWHVLVRVSSFAAFLTVFGLFYHKCVLRMAERLWAARPWRRNTA